MSEILHGVISQAVFAIGRAGAEGFGLLGTGFALAANRIATAYHVGGADDTRMVLILPKISDLSEYQNTSDTSLRTVSLTLLAADPVRDLAIYEVDGGLRLPAYFSVSGTDACPTGHPVIAFGFPHANVGRLVLTRQEAQVGARVLLDSSGVPSKHLVLNTHAREGQSGGPVVDAVSGSVAAILVGSFAPDGGGGISLGGVDPWTLHQTTHAVSAEYLAEMQ